MAQEDIMLSGHDTVRLCNCRTAWFLVLLGGRSHGADAQVNSGLASRKFQSSSASIQWPDYRQLSTLHQRSHPGCPERTPGRMSKSAACADLERHCLENSGALFWGWKTRSWGHLSPLMWMCVLSFKGFQLCWVQFTAVLLQAYRARFCICSYIHPVFRFI